MLTITCPYCGPRCHTEFTYVRDASKTRPPDGEAAMAAWFDFVYLRDNRRGALRELWQHTLGCRGFAIVERDLVTHAVEPAR